MGDLTRIAWKRFRSPDVAIGLLVFLTVMSIARSPVRLVGVSVSDVAQPLRVIALVAFAAAAASAFREAEGSRGALIAPTVPLAAAFVGSVLLTPFPLPELRDILPMLLLVCGAPLVAFSSLRSTDAAEAVLRACAIALAGVLVLNVALIPAVVQSPLRGGRFQGILENPNAVGALGFMAIPLILGALRTLQRGSRLWFGLLALAVIEVALSGSRAGIAGTVAAGAVLYVVWPRAGSVPMRAAAVTGLIVVVAAAAAAIPAVRAGLRIDQISEAGGRANAWPLAADTIAERPAWGHGYGSSTDIFADFGKIPGFQGGYPGNVFLDLGLEAGIVAIAAFVLLLLVGLWRGAEALMATSTHRDHITVVVPLAVVAGGLINAQAESFLVRPGGVGAPLFWFCLGWASAAGVLAAARRVDAARHTRVRGWVAATCGALFVLFAVSASYVFPADDRVRSDDVAQAVASVTGVSLTKVPPAVSTKTVTNVKSAWSGGDQSASVLLLVCRNRSATATVTGGTQVPPDRNSRVVTEGNVVVIYSGHDSAVAARRIRAALAPESTVQ